MIAERKESVKAVMGRSRQAARWMETSDQRAGMRGETIFSATTTAATTIRKLMSLSMWASLVGTPRMLCQGVFIRKRKDDKNCQRSLTTSPTAI